LATKRSLKEKISIINEDSTEEENYRQKDLILSLSQAVQHKQKEAVLLELKELTMILWLNRVLKMSEQMSCIKLIKLRRRRKETFNSLINLNLKDRRLMTLLALQMSQ
jgi:hypothetical protein